MDAESMREDIRVEAQKLSRLFYQNREEQAYAGLSALIPAINQSWQHEIASCPQVGDGAAGKAGLARQGEVLAMMRGFLEAYQAKDQLALADMLCYEIGAMTGGDGRQ